MGDIGLDLKKSEEIEVDMLEGIREGVDLAHSVGEVARQVC